jgi:hypothetical protein
MGLSPRYVFKAVISDHGSVISCLIRTSDKAMYLTSPPRPDRVKIARYSSGVDLPYKANFHGDVVPSLRLINKRDTGSGQVS